MQRVCPLCVYLQGNAAKVGITTPELQQPLHELKHRYNVKLGILNGVYKNKLMDALVSFSKTVHKEKTKKPKKITT